MHTKNRFTHIHSKCLCHLVDINECCSGYLCQTSGTLVYWSQKRMLYRKQMDICVLCGYYDSIICNAACNIILVSASCIDLISWTSSTLLAVILKQFSPLVTYIAFLQFQPASFLLPLKENKLNKLLLITWSTCMKNCFPLCELCPWCNVVVGYNIFFSCSRCSFCIFNWNVPVHIEDNINLFATFSLCHHGWEDLVNNNKECVSIKIRFAGMGHSINNAGLGIASASGTFFHSALHNAPFCMGMIFCI